MSFDHNPLVYLTRRLWKYSEGNRPAVVLYFVLFLCANSIGFFNPLVVAKLLNIVAEQGVTRENLPSLFAWLTLLPALTIAFWIFHGPARVIERKNAFLVAGNYKKYLLDGVMAFPLEWHARHHSGNTIDRIEKGTYALYQYSEDTFQVIEAFIRLTSSFVALSYFNIHASYIVLFFVIVTMVTIVQFDKMLVAQYTALLVAQNGISAKIFDAISNITTVIVLRIETLVSSALYQKIMEPFGLFVRNKKMNEVKWFLVSVFSVSMIFFVLGSYFYFTVAAGATILIGTVYALYEYVDRINGLSFKFAYMYSDIVQQKTAVMNSEEIANEFRQENRKQISKLEKDWRELRVDSLQFSYHSEAGADLHLDDISFAVKRGEKIALIGESGSGKTTLLKVIRNLYHAASGTVALDGKILKQGFSSIASAIALIPQDPEIFSTTIGENITVGVPHPLPYIQRFTDMACFSDVVERLPKKLDSFIFEKGVNLSGGEKQRLALARGLMACDDKELLLFDEPTSSVDTKNELQIFRNIFREFADKTMIVSVHRLHLLPLFDRIYFFSGGKIIASGNLDELRVSSPEFQTLWEKYHATEDEK